MKLLIINNLSSGLGDGSIYDFIRSFTEDGDEVCIRSTDGTTEIGTLLDDASSYDLVVASGGDGTITSVGFHLRNSGIPILPFPAGTGNLLALNLMSPSEPHALAKLARTGKQLNFDLGVVEVEDAELGFQIMAGAGFDAAIMKTAQESKKILGPMAYFTAAVMNMLPKKSHFTINLDGETIESDGVGILLVNFSKIQFDISVTHANKPRDGMLDVVIIKATTALDLVPDLLAGLLDSSGDFPNRTEVLEVHQANHVEVVADPPMDVQYDGEYTQFTTPFKARVIENAASYIVSDEGFDLFN